jgi:hypothetical protein
MIAYDTIDATIKESKLLIKKYRTTPFNKIPKHDLEAFNVAWIMLQAAWGFKKFQAYIKDPDSET